MITLDRLQFICPDTRTEILDSYVEPMNTVGQYYELFYPALRLAAFVAQTAHESGGFNFIKENLNYSADGLLKVFGKYFPTAELAAQYARQPEKIANRVYANRMGNGDENSGDGFKFRGRGLIQLTGRNNYTSLAQSLELTIEDTIVYLETSSGATASAGWFWDNNKLNNYCDNNDFVGLTKRINGGINGLAHRQELYARACEVIK